MKKTITTLTACFLMAFSFSALAQNDSSRTNSKIVLDSDTIKIGDMIIIKKQGGRNNNYDNNSNYRGGRNWNNYNNRKRNRLYGTSLNITNGRIKKDTFLSVNDDTVILGRLNIIK